MWTLLILAYLNGTVAITHVDFMEEKYCTAALQQITNPKHYVMGPNLKVYCLQTYDNQ